MMNAAYPVSYDIDPPEQYNRWTVAFRIILAIPQLILVGGGSYFVFGTNRLFLHGNQSTFGSIFGGGVLSAVLGILVFIAWWAILFTGRFPESFRDFCLLIFRWSQNVHAYMTLQAAPYPPFGEGPYPLRLEVLPANEYNRLTVAFRLIMVIPHAVCLFFLGIAQGLVTIIAWFVILFTGNYPPELYRFSVGVSRWSARVAAYMFLFVDEYPPFSLEAQPSAGQLRPETT